MQYQQDTIYQVLRNLSALQAAPMIISMQAMMSDLEEGLSTLGHQLASAISGGEVDKRDIKADNFFEEKFSNILVDVLDQVNAIPDDFFSPHDAIIVEAFDTDAGRTAFEKMTWIQAELPNFSALDQKLLPSEVLAFNSLNENDPRFTEAFDAINVVFLPLYQKIDEAS